ncbi:large ribosomal subunit protein eL39-like [Desmodus rotundus]|uniref:large ribosomal subunit protein eL39-like n=1 Tax=Desmodus rotundus TaxID=9430 RepID=UPI002380F96B|nr:60S ribosomal protein L39-like [Desmodus rotundus]
MSSHETFRTERFLVKKRQLNGPIAQWVRVQTGNKMGCSCKRRHWGRTNNRGLPGWCEQQL